MSRKITFRLLNKNDIELIIVFVKELYDQESIFFDEVITRRALDTLIGQSEFGSAWAIEVKGLAVGYLVLTFGYSLAYGGRNALLDELYLRPDVRGQGIGTQALAFAEAASREAGAHTLHLEVGKTNTRAQQLYSRVGFENQGRYWLTKQLP
jgi:diamine N-acetyltransferase